MAGKNTISITFKLDGDNKGFKQLANDADGFKKAITGVISKSQELNANAINFAAIATGIDQAQQSVNQLLGVVKDLTSAYAQQQEAEIKLETAMRDNMGAREEDIDTIKRLCSEQQKLGVIGDEVQLAGAQQLAMFVKQRSSLEALIPAMNDVIAKQYGLNASQGDAASVASLLGKALAGQAGGLKRAGLTFSDAQAQLLKYGTENEKVATLIDIVNSKMGGLNATLAATDLGKQKQLENILGDIKETLGSLVAGIQPYITLFATTTTAVGGITKLVLALASWNVGQKLLNITLLASGMNATRVAKAIRVLSAAEKTAAETTVALKVAMRSLMMATGVGAAIAGVVYVIEKLCSSSEEATEKTEELTRAQASAKAHSEALANARRNEAELLSTTQTKLNNYITKLKNFNGTKAEEKKLVTELNDIYGSKMGYFSTVSDWYKTLTANSKTYCEQLVNEARIQNNAQEIARLYAENRDIVYNSDGSKKKYSAQRKTAERTVYRNSALGRIQRKQKYSVVGSSEAEQANATVTANNKRIKQLTSDNDKLIKSTAKLAVVGLNVKPTFTPDTVKTTEAITTATEEAADATEEIVEVVNDAAQSINEYNKNISILTDQLNEATDADTAANLNEQIEHWEALKDAMQNAGKASKDTAENAVPEEVGKQWNEKAATLAEINDNISILQDKLETADVTEASALNKQIKLWEEKADAIRNAGLEVSDTFGKFKDGYRAVRSMGDSISSLTDTLSGNSSAWAKTMAIVDTALAIYEGLSVVMALLSPLFQKNAEAQTQEAVSAIASTAAQGAQIATAEPAAAALAPVIAANKAAAASYLELATAGYMAAHAYIPFVGFGIAAGFSIAAKAMAVGMGATPFAEGGVLYGPTLGLLGEYSGASNNPEVVAPLDKLRSLIQPDNALAGKVEFEIDGRKLRGVLRKVENLSSRS